MAEAGLFETVANRDFLGFDHGQRVDYKKVANFLELTDNDLSKIGHVRKDSVRLDNDAIPKDLAVRLREIAIIANLVAEFFGGDASRTAAWFYARNPNLGNVRPRDMLRLGRFHKLHQFILEAREEAGWGRA